MFDIQAIPLGFLFTGLAILIVLAVATMTNLKTGLLVMAVMFFVASTATQGDEMSGVRLWLYPLQVNRSPIYLAFGVALGVALLGHLRHMKATLPAQGLILLLISFYGGLLRFFQESPAAGLMSLGFACATLIPLMLLAGGIIKRWDDCYIVVRGIAAANVVWIGAVAVQVVLNASLLYAGKDGRFFGITGNPQHAGTTLAMMGTVVLWLLLNDPQRKYRILWIALFSVDAILLVWTGSRTGAGMFVVGAGMATYARLGRTVVYLPLIAIAVVGAYSLFSGSFSLEAAERLSSTENTRADAWAEMWAIGRANPWFGVGIANAQNSENSFLYAFAAYGLGMVALVAVFVAVSGLVCLRLFGLRWRLEKQQRGFVDLVLGYNAMYFAGSVFEGYIMARVANTLVMMLIFSVMTARIFAFVREDQRALLEDEAHADEDFADDEDYGDEDYGDYGDGDYEHARTHPADGAGYDPA